MNNKYELLAIGNAIVDILAQVEEEFLAEHDLVKDGMSLINEDQAKKIYSAMSISKEVSGGSAANTAAAFAYFGGKAAFIGKIKDDKLGDIFARDIEKQNIYFATLRANDGVETARSFIAITPDAKRTMATYLGATRNLTCADIDEELIKESKLIYLEGYLWDSEPAIEAMKKAVKIARTHNKLTAFTLSDVFCVQRHKESFLKLIKDDIDILFANENELFELLNITNISNVAKEVTKLNCKIICVTRSEKGSIIIAGDKNYTIEAQKNLKIIDSTGAGDLYAAGFLYGYLQNYDLQKCGNLACDAASKIITQIGARF